MKENTRKYKHYLYDLILELKQNPQTFAKSLGFERTDRVYNVLKEANGVSVDLANIIIAEYPKVNYDWLLTGEGEMIKKNSNNLTSEDKKAIPLEKEVGNLIEVIRNQSNQLTKSQEQIDRLLTLLEEDKKKNAGGAGVVRKAVAK